MTTELFDHEDGDGVVQPRTTLNMAEQRFAEAIFRIAIHGLVLMFIAVLVLGVIALTLTLDRLGYSVQDTPDIYLDGEPKADPGSDA